MPPLITPAAEVLTATVMVPLAPLLLLPARMPLKLPVPLIRPAPVPLVAPKLALRSSTKPAAPVAVLRMTRFCVTTWPDLHGAEVQRRALDRARSRLVDVAADVDDLIRIGAGHTQAVADATDRAVGSVQHRDGAGLGARGERVDTHVHRRAVAAARDQAGDAGGVVGGRARVGAEAGVEVFAEGARGSGVAHRQRLGQRAVHTLVGQRHRRRCGAAHGGVVRRRAGAHHDVELLVGNVLEVAAQVEHLAGQRRQRAGAGGVEGHRQVAAVGARVRRRCSCWR